MAAQVNKTRWNDAISYFKSMKKIILKDPESYCNGKVTSKEPEVKQSR